MQIKIDVKSLVLGILLGAVCFAALGAALGGASKADFAIAVQNSGTAIVRADDGTLFSVDPDRGRADIIEYRDGPYQGKYFNMTRSMIRKRKSSSK